MKFRVTCHECGLEEEVDSKETTWCLLEFMTGRYRRHRRSFCPQCLDGKSKRDLELDFYFHLRDNKGANER